MFDLKAILNFPFAYNTLQNLVRKTKHTVKYINEYIRPQKGNFILDIGCGTAEILDFLTEVRYYGFDMSPEYIESAKKKYGARGVFVCSNLNEVSIPEEVRFDVVLANSVLHHLNNNEAARLFALAKKYLKPGGRLITSDGCRKKGEGLISKVVLSLDRGKYVRDETGYLNLARQVFGNVSYETRNDLANIPVNGIFITCVKD